MARIETLKNLILQSDNTACFIERERILMRLANTMQDYHEDDKFAVVFATLLSEVSTPLHECDYFAGRAVEGAADEQTSSPNNLIYSTGHMSFDYAKVLSIGLSGILEEIQKNAKTKGDKTSLSFAHNAEIVVHAIHAFAVRYAKVASEKGFERMAKALEKVPFEPAYDFYSALQSIWLLHFIASCYVGSRDYAFGRFDQYMLPYYEAALKNGQTEEELTELLSGFIIKTNEICGRATHNYMCKPILCQSSKQYINIGGENPNAFSSVVLNAAKLCNLAQPEIVVLLKPDADPIFTKNVFEALTILTDKVNLYNYDIILESLLRKGVDKEVAKDFTFSACCTFDLNYHTIRQEYYVPVPQVFLSVLHGNTYHSVKEIASAFKDAIRQKMQEYVDLEKDYDGRQQFVMDGVLLSDSAMECRYPTDGGAKYNVLNLFCPGIATLGDSLLAIDKLVFQSNRYSYEDFMQILKDNYKDHEDLRQEILSYTRFGNDTENDEYTVMAATAFLDALDELKLKENEYAVGGFYSLERDNTWAYDVQATPDGRKAGSSFSENQSPTYGADKSGLLAMLNSLSKLPFNRASSGGLNIKFAQKQSAEVLQSIVEGYFKQGGLHVGISIVDREMLEDAMIHPEKYQSLTVRVYGFSEYFVSLPKWQQIAILNRTVYE